MVTIDIKVTWSKVKVKLLVFVQMMSAQCCLTLCKRVTKLNAVDAPREYLIPNDFQVTWLNVFVQMMSTKYLLTSLLDSLIWYRGCP